MTVLSKQDIPRPALPKETVDVPELGGEVVVQALLLRDQLDLSTKQLKTFGHFSHMLALTVVDANGDPIFSMEEWEVWGASHLDVALKLFGAVKRLSGMGDEEKKEPAPS